MSWFRATVVGCICVVALAGSRLNADSRQQGTDEGNGQWKVLKELQGSTGQHTEPLAAPKEPWRVSYKGKGRTVWGLGYHHQDEGRRAGDGGVWPSGGNRW